MLRILTLLVILLVTMNSSQAQDKPHYTMGTGSVGATYYPVGKAICDMVNVEELSFTCEAVSTGGSVYNLKSIQNGTHDFGISQAFVQHQSYLGTEKFKAEGANESLRTITPLHTETMLLSVAKESSIKSFADLKGKKVNLGNAGSGTHTILRDLLSHKNLAVNFFSEVLEHKSSELPKLFCEDKLDAAIYSTGHPNKIYTKLIEECGVELVDLWDEEIDNFVKQNSQFVKASLPKGIYKNQEKTVLGFGIPVVLSASDKIPEQHISEMLKLLKSKHDALVKVNPVFNTIDFVPIKSNSLAPYHEGTRNAFNVN